MNITDILYIKLQLYTEFNNLFLNLHSLKMSINEEPSEQRRISKSFKEIAAPLTNQQKVEQAINLLFYKWGGLVSHHPCKVFFISLVVFLALASGVVHMEHYENERLNWTPEGNPSIAASARAQEMFPQRGGVIGAIAQSKVGNVLTVEAYKELLAFQEMLFACKAKENTTQISYESICD